MFPRNHSVSESNAFQITLIVVRIVKDKTMACRRQFALGLPRTGNLGNRWDGYPKVVYLPTFNPKPAAFDFILSAMPSHTVSQILRIIGSPIE